MRPVRLDLDGFASFREPTHVDFTDVDYFALVGPTGAGKSTIIDAITFALYGTAPRWGRTNAVSYALAPTTNRCTVSLIFDVGGQRYQAVREVRRVGQQIQQKNARLEQFTDPTACPAPGEEAPTSEVLASEVRDMTGAVSKLLGMDFEDFCQCVVLPQGEFARFLKAKSSDRQEILLKLLGGGHYDEIAKRAGRLAAESSKEAEMYDEQLGGLAHASEDAVAGKTAEVERLTEAVSQVGMHVKAALEARDAGRAHALSAENAAAALAVLEPLAAPEGLAARQDDLASARAEDGRVAGTQTEADAAVVAAVNAAVAGPQRATLEQAAKLYAEHNQIGERLEAAAAAASQTEKDAGAAQAAAAAARVEATQARTNAEAAATTHTAAQQARNDLTTLVDELGSVQLPHGLTETATKLGDLGQSRHSAQQTADAHRERAEQLTADIAGLPDERRLQELHSKIAAWRSLASEYRECASQLGEDIRSEHAARATQQEATDAVEDRTREHQAARTAAGALALRPTLQVGHECPVCTQTVQTLPERTDEPELAAHEERVSKANQAAAQAAAQVQAAHAQVARRRASFEHLTTQLRALSTGAPSALAECAAAVGTSSVVPSVDVPELPDQLFDPHTTQDAEPDAAPDTASDTEAAIAWVAAAEKTAEAVHSAATEAEAVLSSVEKAVLARSESAEQARGEAETSRKAAEAARRAHEEATSELDAVRVSLIRAHAALASRGAPDVDTDTAASVVSSWATLVQWAHARGDALRAEDLPQAQRDYDEAAATLSSARDKQTEAEQRAEDLEADARDAYAAHSAALTLQRELNTRNSEITTELAAAPALTDLPTLLAQAQANEDERTRAIGAQREALQAREATTAALRRATNAVAEDRNALGTARDAAGPWGPPAFTSSQMDEDLASCWEQMLAWSAEKAQSARTQRADAEKAQGEAAEAADAAVARIEDLLTSNELPVIDVAADPRAAETVVAVARSQAEDAVAALTAARKQAGALTTKRDDAVQKAQVANELKSLLRADKFGNWLATAALDTLVAGASDSLRQLSDGQFTLTHLKGDFHVIDHFDADTTRSVKTLSGGETFQASLALALALSEQLAALAAGGTAKLDAIFLDEGFGTLDPESLEMVAATLETLAQGERMVGVVTHVAALAERTPTRFAVHHDGRTSSVERESA